MSKLISFFRRHPIRLSLSRQVLKALAAGLLAAGCLPGLELLWWASAPIALFLAVTGFQNTGCREKYLFALYLVSLSARLAVMTAALPVTLSAGTALLSSLLSSLFLTVFVLYFLQRVRTGLQKDNAVLTILSGAALALPVLSGMLSALVPESPLFLLFPSPLLCTGGVLWIAFGVGFFLFLISKQKTATFYVLLCAAAALASGFSAAFMPPCAALLSALPMILSVSEKSDGSKSAMQKGGFALARQGQEA